MLQGLRSFFTRGGKGALAGAVTERAGDALGPYSNTEIGGFVPREMNPFLYEAIREAVGPIDAAINMTTVLDGIIAVGGDNDALVQEIDDWMKNIRVNDLETGFQSFYRSQGNEMYEQGFVVGEPILALNDVVQLRVADSKGVIFKRVEGGALETWYRKPAPSRGRRDGTDNIERVLRNSYQNVTTGMLERNNYRKLDPMHLVYAVFNPEADGPYGTSLMRSTEFDTKVLLTMKNALHRTWDRFGDPILDVQYKTKAKISPAELDKRRKEIADNIATAMSIKASGNSADVVNGVGKDDEIIIKVLGADGQVLDIEMPAKFIMESIISKTGLPAWMLGYHWSTAERLAQRQGEIALQMSKTRFTTRQPGLEGVIKTMLRARGRTWKKGDWFLCQELPSLQDIVAKAQAGFLEAQTEMMRGNAGQSQGGDNQPGKSISWRMDPDGAMTFSTGKSAAAGGCGCGSPHPGPLPGGEGVKALREVKGESYVEDEAALLRLEQRSERAMLGAWANLHDDVITVLGLENTAKAAEPVFVFDRAIAYAELLALGDAFAATVGGEGGELVKTTIAAWVRGTLNGAAEFNGMDSVDEAARTAMEQSAKANALQLVKDATVRAYTDDIVKALADGAYNGMNPVDVARALRNRFDAHDYDWVRLARSEIAQAQADGKIAQYAAHEVEQYDWIPAGDGCPICVGKAQGGPYLVGSGPLPMRDSHPLCRCTVAAVIDD